MTPEIYSPNQIRSILRDRNVKEVSRGCGVAYDTLRDLLNGADSRISTFRKLSEYIDSTAPGSME